MRGSSFCSSAVHQASRGASVSDGSGSTATVARPALTSAMAWAGLRWLRQRRQRAEMLARELGEQRGRIGVADGDDEAALHGGGAGQQFAPDADDRLRRQGAGMARQQPADDRRLAPGP